jgi:hypothetical protein
MFIPIPSNSANKEKIVNENYLLQEAINRGVIDRTLVSPPNSPSSEGVYIPTNGATGAWGLMDNLLVWWNPDGYWRTISPNEGMKVFSQAVGEIGVEYVAGAWQAIAVTANTGGGSNKILPVPKNFWPFDGNLVDVQEGKHLTDPSLSGLAEIGTDYDFVAGKFGQAVNFLNNQRITNNSYDLVIGSEFSISAWINRRGRLNLSHYSADAQGNSESYYVDLIAQINPSSVDIWFNSHEYKYTASTSSSESSAIDNSQAYGHSTIGYVHVVVSREYDNTDCITKYYVNGEYAGQDVLANALTTGNIKTFNTIDVTTKFGDPPGYVDNLRIYDRVLSAEEVQMLANE